MKIDLSFIKRKVARRIFIQFVMCALVPIIALTIITFFQVRTELEKQGQIRLHETARTWGTSIFDRLINLENYLKIFSLGLNLGSGDRAQPIDSTYIENLKKPFKALALVDDSGKTVPFFGKAPVLPKLSPEQQKHLLSGKSLVSISSDKEKTFHIYMMKRVDPQSPGRRALWGEINPMHLWGLDENDTLPALMELSVLDSASNVIFSTISIPFEFGQRSEFKKSRSELSHFKWADKDQPYQAGYWSVFMNYQWGYPKLIVVMSTKIQHIFAPIAFFKKIFPMVILLSIWVVLFLSAVQIRRTTQPLQELAEGTRRIAGHDFESRVTVTSGDEFEELGESFNKMARQLGRQFNALTTIGAIDRAILSSLETEKIVNTAITRMKDIFDYKVAGISLLDSRRDNIARAYVKEVNPDTESVIENIEISLQELQMLADNREIILMDGKENISSRLIPFAGNGFKSFVVFPLFIKEALAGLIVLGLHDSGQYNEEDLQYARQVANQVAVALSNARLLEELDRLSWGALTALARTVDAKSPWTAGHSERVTKIAMEIGRALGLLDEELQNLHRGALLHDIGKIGTPAKILNKVGKLTGAERQVVQAHSAAGARILEPISAYAQAIPVVLQHHERFDGKGYPNGLAGEEISLGGRILALADVYDAMLSDRPYRAGMQRERVMATIRESAGKHFDPKIVQAFLTVVNQQTEQLADCEK